MRGRLIANRKKKKKKGEREGRRHIRMAQVRLSLFFDTTFIGSVVVVVVFQCQVMFYTTLSELKKKKKKNKNY